MNKMQASVFKSRCLKVMDRVQATGEPVIVTKRGKPVVKAKPAEQEKDDLFGFSHEGTDGIFVGEIESLVVPLSDWNALQGRGGRMILLDTCVVAWMASEPEKLSRPASDAIRDASGSGGIVIAALALWELAQLMTAGRLRITGGGGDAFVEEIAGRTDCYRRTFF